MKTSELLEVRKEKPVDDKTVSPGARVGRIIKSILGGKEPLFALYQTVSQPKKNGDAVVNIEVDRHRGKYDLATMVDDDDDEGSKAIKAKLQSRLKTPDIPTLKKDFMLRLFKEVKEKLSGLNEVGYHTGGDKNTYTYVPVDKFNPEEMIKDWSGRVRFKFAFSDKVHAVTFDVTKEAKVVSQELLALIKKDPEFDDLKAVENYGGNGFYFRMADKAIAEYEKRVGMKFTPPQKANEYARGAYDASLEQAARAEYQKKHWEKNKKKIKALFATIKTPIRLTVSGVNSYNMSVTFQKPTAASLGK